MKYGEKQMIHMLGLLMWDLGCLQIEKDDQKKSYIVERMSRRTHFMQGCMDATEDEK